MFCTSKDLERIGEYTSSAEFDALFSRPSDTLQITKPEENHEKMSLIGIMPCVNGAVIFSDTRCTHTERDGRIWYDDCTTKIRQVPGTNIVLALSGANTFGKEGEFSLDDLVRSLPALDRPKIFKDIVRYLTDVEYYGRMFISLTEVTHVDNGPQVIIDCINVSPQNGFTFKTEILNHADGILFYHGTSWTVEVAKQRTFRPMHTDDFENEARELISMVYDASSGFDVDKRTVGPYADVFTIKRNFDKSGQYDVFHMPPENLR